MTITCSNCGFDNLSSAHLCIKCHTPLEDSHSQKLSGKIEVKKTEHSAPSVASSAPNFSKTILGKQAFDKEASPVPTPVAVSPPTVVDDLPKTPTSPTLEDDPKTITCPDVDCGFVNIATRTTCIRCQRELITHKNDTSLPQPPDFVMNKPQTPNSTEESFSPKPLIGGTIDPYRMRMSSTERCYLQRIPKIGETIDIHRSEFKLSNDESVVLNRDNLDSTNQSITSKAQAELSFENGKWFLINRSEQQTTFIQVSEKTEIKDGDILLMGDRKLIFKTESEEKIRQMQRT